MKFEIALSRSRKHVVCTVLEPVTTEFAFEFARAAVDFSRQHGLKRQLYDCRRVRNVDSIYRNYDFAYKDMVNLELAPDNRAAILVAVTDRSHDFVEIVARNAQYNVKIFVDEEDAIAWLEQS